MEISSRRGEDTITTMQISSRHPITTEKGTQQMSTRKLDFFFLSFSWRDCVTSHRKLIAINMIVFLFCFFFCSVTKGRISSCFSHFPYSFMETPKKKLLCVVVVSFLMWEVEWSLVFLEFLITLRWGPSMTGPFRRFQPGSRWWLNRHRRRSRTRWASGCRLSLRRSSVCHQDPAVLKQNTTTKCNQHRQHKWTCFV